MLGAGFMARTHSTAARLAGAQLDVLAASRPETSRTAAAALGYARSASPEELLVEGLGVVHVCTPNTTHLDYARAALLAGSHVICEKPLATSGADARELADLSEQRGLVGAVPFVYRYHPMVREARARIASGEAGTVLTVSGQYLQDWLLAAGDDNWRVATDSGGPSRAFADIGSHLVDLVEFVSGDRITRLVATTRTVHEERAGQPVHTEDAVALTLELAGGGIGSLLISQVAPGRKNGLVLEIAGSHESIRFEQEDPERLWVGRRGASLLLRRDPDTLSVDAARLSNVPAGHAQGYQDAFNGFVADAYAAVAGEHPEGLPTFRDGLRAALITDAVLESAEAGTWVEVSKA
ncbi:Gfo/Idh/MocA family protein [Leucobacter sp. USHLN153]|uniref:Gfo/Idh/MocA family protein n=1 Tax=Leucobacter sp. USHLN153 TaxID=3081268 RepID=UPI0030167790